MDYPYLSQGKRVKEQRPILKLQFLYSGSLIEEKMSPGHENKIAIITLDIKFTFYTE